MLPIPKELRNDLERAQMSMEDMNDKLDDILNALADVIHELRVQNGIKSERQQ